MDEICERIFCGEPATAQRGETDNASVDLQSDNFLGRLYLPQPDCVVLAARRQPAVWQHCQSPKPAYMTFEPGGLGACLEIPHADRAVRAA